MSLLIKSAVEAHKSGRTEEAISLYEMILEADPSIAQIHYVLGCLLMDEKRLTEAYEHLQSAVNLKKDLAAYNGAFGTLLMKMKRHGQALEYFRKAASLKDANEEVFHCYCNSLLICGRYNEAWEISNSALIRFPPSPRIIKDLIECSIASGSPEKLREMLDLGLGKGLIGRETELTLEHRLASMKKDKDAALQTALTWKKEFPDSTEAMRACARANKAAGHPDDAVNYYLGIYEKHPNDNEALVEIGNWLARSNRNYEASRFFRIAVNNDPKNDNTRGSLAFSLYKSAESPAHGDDVEEGYYHFCKLHEKPRPDLRATIGMSSILLNMLRVREGLLYFDKAVNEFPDVYVNASSRLFHDCYAWYFSKEEMYKRHLSCAKTTRRLAGKARKKFDNTPDPEKRLKVGFISGDFIFHPVSYFFISAFEAIKDDFDTHIYHHIQPSGEDGLTARYKKGAKLFRNIFGLSDSELQKTVIEDGIDVMIDISGHTSLNRLKAMALRFAPIQASWLGYPNTTGIDTIDFRISDDVTEPEGLMENFSSERIIRLPGGFHLYRPPYRIPETVAPLPALKNKYITFGSFNNLKKASPLAIEAWSKLLCEIPSSRLLIKDRNLEGNYMRERVFSIFASFGVSPSRITVMRLMPNNYDHMCAYNNVDIALDCFPYNGTTTTCEALVMGCPVVTRMGDAHVSRVSTSILTHIGHTEWIARDMDEFVAIGKNLASDIGKLSQIRQKLRNDMYASPLCDPQRMRRELGDAIRFMWRDWCSRTADAANMTTQAHQNN